MHPAILFSLFALFFFTVLPSGESGRSTPLGCVPAAGRINSGKIELMIDSGNDTGAKNTILTMDLQKNEGLV